MLTSTLAIAVAAAATSGWTVQRAASRMDDTKTVTLTLQAAEAISGWPNKTVVPRLVLRCKGNGRGC
jgi:hypothetical protein